MNSIEKNQQIVEIKLLENQINQLEQQISLIDQQIVETQMMETSLDGMKKIKNKDAFVSVGRDVFIESNIKSVNNVLVNVGNGIFIKKTIEEAKKTINRHNQKLFGARKETIKEINNVFMSITNIEKELM